MKKKMLFMAAIAGLFVLGSCVKDDVSGSVEAVRQAKANQLNGLANQANANAALLNAQAAHENAIIAADAALKQAQAASAQAQAQIDQMDAQLKGDALAAELADKLADFEANTATNKAILQNQLNALQIALRNAATSNYDDIAALIANYRTAYNDFTLAEQNLINAKVGLETAEINAKYAEDVAAAMILGLEQDIDRYTKELEALEAVDQKGISTPKQALAAGDALQGAIDIATAEFAESPAIGAFLDAAAAWYKAYKAYLDYNDPTNGVFAKLNTATNAAVGKDYYTNIGTKDVAKAAIAAFGLADYSTYADPFVFGGNTEVSPAIAKVTVDQYRVLEEGKLLTDNYLKTYTKTQSDALKAAKDAKADLEGQLGKEGDKKDTKYKDAVTLYGALAGATEVYDKAAKAEADAKKAMADKPAAVQAALDALVAENSKKTVDDAKWIAAVVTLADAVVDAYGAPAYDPNLKKYATPANDQDAIDYLIGVNAANTLGYTKAWMQDPDNVKLLFKNGDAKCIVTAWASDASKKDATEVAKVEDVANRDAKAVNVIAAYKAAQNDTKTAKTAKDAAQKAVNDQPQKIAAAQDKINVAQDNLDNADAKKAELEGLIAACDTEAYQEVIDAVATATDDYNQALIDLFAARQELTDLEDEQAACYAVATQNVDVLIANAKANLATAEENLATWKANNTQEQIIAAAKKNVSDAQAEVEIATAALLAAQQDLKDANIEFDLTDDDEPTEEPTEEPTVVEEPAEEGGEG